MTPSYESLRDRMVDEQIVRRGITDPRVITAFRKVPRHEFVGDAFKEQAYDDYPLPTCDGQTISQPYMVALMTESLALGTGDRVLEVGTGSGYQAAIIAEIVRGPVYSIERFEGLAATARSTLARLGYTTVTIQAGDGTIGWEEYAPYDGIVVTAAAPAIPPSLTRQLKDGGRLVIPVGGAFGQALTVVEKRRDTYTTREICGCVFVPLIGKEGWHEEKPHDA